MGTGFASSAQVPWPFIRNLRAAVARSHTPMQREPSLVQLTPTGTTIVLEGIMDVECRLPGLDVPGGIVEGVNLVVPGVANFNKPVSGSTLFRKIS